MGFLKTVGKTLSSLNPVAGIISSGIGAIGNAISTNSTNKANAAINDKNNAFNAAEAEKARTFNAQQTSLQNEFNASEAQKSRQWQQQMFERQLAYNSPQNQLKMMAEAGLNPNNFASGLTTAPSVGGSPQASGSALSGPSASSAGAIPMSNPFDFESVTQSIKNLAESRKIESDTRHVDALTATENLLRDGKVQLQSTTIALNVANAELRKKEMDRIGKELIAIDTNIDMVKQNIRESIASENYRNQMAYYQSLKSEEQKTINNKLEERILSELREARSRIDRNYSSIRVDNATIDKIASEISINNLNLSNMPVEFYLNNRLVKAKIVGLESENTIIQPDVESLSTVSDHEAYRVLKAINVYIKEMLSPLSSIFKSLPKIAK